MTDEMVRATNRIGKATEAYEKAEEEKELLMVGNEEKTELRLSKTNEHGQILMTISSLCNQIIEYSEARENSKIFFKPSFDREKMAKDFDVIRKNEEDAGAQLTVIEDTLDNFYSFVRDLKYESDPQGVPYLQKF